MIANQAVDLFVALSTNNMAISYRELYNSTTKRRYLFRKCDYCSLTNEHDEDLVQGYFCDGGVYANTCDEHKENLEKDKKIELSINFENLYYCKEFHDAT